MKFAERFFVAASVGVPMWPASAAMSPDRRAAARSGGGGLFQRRTALAIFCVTTSLWLALIALMISNDQTSKAGSMTAILSPAMFGLVNVILCAAGLVCAGFDPRSASKMDPVRKGITISSVALMLMWLFVLSNF